MRSLCSFLVLSATLSATAQTLTGPTNNMVPGDVCILHHGSGTPPGAAGSINWNYFSLSSSGAPEAQLFEPPSTSSFASLFPSATVRVQNTFMRGDATGLYILGYGDPDGSMVYTDTERQFAFPCSYQTTWTDTFSGSTGTGTSENGSLSGTADGTGTLVLPYGSFSNVLRVHITSSIEFVFDGGGFTAESDDYYYFKPGVRFPLLIASADGESITWLDQGSVGVEDLLAQAIGVDVFPNPATGAVNVLYSATGGRLQMDLVSASGSVVLQRSLNAGSGIQKQPIDLEGLAPGLYTVRISDAQGGQGMRRLLVQ